MGTEDFLCFIFYFYVSKHIAYWSVCLSGLCQKSSRLSKNCAKICTCVIYLIIALCVNTADGPCFCTHPLTNQNHLDSLPYFCAHRVFIVHYPSEKITESLFFSALKHLRLFWYLCPKSQPNYELVLIWHHIKESLRMFESWPTCDVLISEG